MRKRNEQKTARVEEMVANGSTNDEIQAKIKSEFQDGVSNSALSKIRKNMKRESDPLYVKYNTLHAAFDHIRKNNKDIAKAFYYALPEKLRGEFNALFD